MIESAEVAALRKQTVAPGIGQMRDAAASQVAVIAGPRKELSLDTHPPLLVYKEDVMEAHVDPR